MTATFIAFQAVRPQAEFRGPQDSGQIRRDGWQQFQAHSRPEITGALERLSEQMCLERYSLRDRDRLQSALEDACAQFLSTSDPSFRLCLGVRIQSDRVKVTLEILGDEGSPSYCEAGILLKGFELRWARYRKVGAHLELLECRVLHG